MSARVDDGRARIACESGPGPCDEPVVGVNDCTGAYTCLSHALYRDWTAWSGRLAHGGTHRPCEIDDGIMGDRDACSRVATHLFAFESNMTAAVCGSCARDIDRELTGRLVWVGCNWLDRDDMPRCDLPGAFRVDSQGDVEGDGCVCAGHAEVAVQDNLMGRGDLIALPPVGVARG
jgi:hypothetical protein